MLSYTHMTWRTKYIHFKTMHIAHYFRNRTIIAIIADWPSLKHNVYRKCASQPKKLHTAMHSHGEIFPVL